MLCVYFFVLYLVFNVRLRCCVVLLLCVFVDFLLFLFGFLVVRLKGLGKNYSNNKDKDAMRSASKRCLSNVAIALQQQVNVNADVY